MAQRYAHKVADMSPEELKASRLLKRMDPTKVPDPPRQNRYGARVLGKRYKMGIYQFWSNLFCGNEGLPKSRKMTDETIKLKMLEEYPNSSAIKNLGAIGERGAVTVNYYRGLYNKGKLTQNKIPPRRSYRYNSAGSKVRGNTGTRELTKEEIDRMEEQFAARKAPDPEE